MNEEIYSRIKNNDKLIEEKRLAIKKEKKDKSKYHDRFETISNIYEYLATPLCAISISLVALLSGPIVYVLPILATCGALGITSYKFYLRRKMDLINDNIRRIKLERQDCYNQREKDYEKIFSNLENKGMDVEHYYKQLVKLRRECDDLSAKMAPHKNKKEKLEKFRGIISRVFDYGLVPVGAVILPVICAFADVGTIGEIVTMGVSSAALLACATLDNGLTKKIENLEDEIEDIKSDRTFRYAERDLKLASALEFLKKNDIIHEKYNMQKEKNITEKNTNRKGKKQKNR